MPRAHQVQVQLLVSFLQTNSHETFVPLVPDKKLKATWKKEGEEVRSEKVTGAVWYEAIEGRNDEDVTSTLIKLLTEPQYLKKLFGGRITGLCFAP